MTDSVFCLDFGSFLEWSLLVYWFISHISGVKLDIVFIFVSGMTTTNFSDLITCSQLHPPGSAGPQASQLTLGALRSRM